MCWKMSDSPRRSQGACPGAMVMGRKMVVAAGTPQHPQEGIHAKFPHGIQSQGKEKAPKKATRTIQDLSQLLSEEHLSKLGISGGQGE